MSYLELVKSKIAYWKEVCKNPNIQESYFEEHFHEIPFKLRHLLIKNPNISLNFVYSHFSSEDVEKKQYMITIDRLKRLSNAMPNSKQGKLGKTTLIRFHNL
jgi:hypothetical protein